MLTARGKRQDSSGASFLPLGPCHAHRLPLGFGVEEGTRGGSRGQSCQLLGHLHQGGPGKSFLSSLIGAWGLGDPGILRVGYEHLWLLEGPGGILILLTTTTIPLPPPPAIAVPPLGLSSSLSSLWTYIYPASSTQKPFLCRQGIGLSPEEDMEGMGGAGEE